jgi:hypothetical protein
VIERRNGYRIQLARDRDAIMNKFDLQFAGAVFAHNGKQSFWHEQGKSHWVAGPKQQTVFFNREPVQSFGGLIILQALISQITNFLRQIFHTAAYSANHATRGERVASAGFDGWCDVWHVATRGTSFPLGAKRTITRRHVLLGWPTTNVFTGEESAVVMP